MLDQLKVNVFELEVGGVNQGEFVSLMKASEVVKQISRVEKKDDVSAENALKSLVADGLLSLTEGKSCE